MPVLHVQWTITPAIPPQPRLPCQGCGRIMNFCSSGKARLNANGKTLYAWLIYRCTTCDATWNRTIFARRNVRDIDPDMLRALQENDPYWMNDIAFDIDALRRVAYEVEEFSDASVTKRVLSDDGAPWSGLDITLHIGRRCALRLDRLLATELKISRARLASWEGRLRINGSPDMGTILRRSVKDGTRVRIDITDIGGSLAIAAIK